MNDLYVPIMYIERPIVVKTGHVNMDSQAYHQGHIIPKCRLKSVLHMMLFGFILKSCYTDISIFNYFARMENGCQLTIVFILYFLQEKY